MLSSNQKRDQNLRIQLQPFWCGFSNQVIDHDHDIRVRLYFRSLRGCRDPFDRRTRAHRCRIVGASTRTAPRGGEYRADVRAPGGSSTAHDLATPPESWRLRFAELAEQCGLDVDIDIGHHGVADYFRHCGTGGGSAGPDSIPFATITSGFETRSLQNPLHSASLSFLEGFQVPVND